MAAAPEISDIRIREIDETAEMRAVEELQKEVWGIPDLDVVPLTQLVAAKEAGGALIGAFDGKVLVGFVYGFPSFEHGELAHHSHMLGVKPAFRNLDLGRRLKLAQRDHVIAQGIRLVSWTFDPLQSLNAHFNFGKLGVLCDRYLPHFYGEDATSFLHQTGTDRLWVSWFVSSERVIQRIAGVDEPLRIENVVPLLQVARDETPGRNDLVEALAREHATIEIPSNIDALQQQNREAALQWRAETRWAFTEALQAGYVIESFTRERQVGRYVLTKTDLFELAS
jgi:predicted GNAT superfamily acetyltransferase